MILAILNRDILTELYDATNIRAVRVLGASHDMTAYTDSVPAGQDVIKNDDQPNPVVNIERDS